MDRLLGNGMSLSYLDKPKEERRRAVKKQNIQLIVGKVDKVVLEQEINKLQNSGYAPLSLNYILGSVCAVAAELGLKAPYLEYKSDEEMKDLAKKDRKEIKDAQTRFVRSILGKTQFAVDEYTHEVKVTVEKDGEIHDVTRTARASLLELPEGTKHIGGNTVYVSEAMRAFRTLATDNGGLAIIHSSPLTQEKGPVIHIGTDAASEISGRRNADRSLNVGEGRRLSHLGLLRETVRFQRLLARQNRLKEGLQRGEIKVLPNFKRDSWPSHPLIAHMKASVMPYIAEELKRTGALCDEQDIRYQVLFRLTTFPLEKLFEHGDHLKGSLVKQGSYFSWQRIPEIKPAVLEQYRLDADLARQVVREQLTVITDRMKRSPLPIADILTPRGIFAEKGWEVIKRNDQIFAVNRQKGEEVPLEFREVPKDIAEAFHRDLHYIHTPRVDWSFGLYIQGEALPFSVLGVQKVDRDYKKDVLLMHGFDPDNCVDFTRLYSRPGSPFNTSTAIFGSAFAYFRQQYPEMQAAVSAFMPSYAAGLSMVSGGFETPVMVKEGRQTFERKRIGGKEVWEFVTKRRKGMGKTIESQIPMLPTIELISPIKKPRLAPIEEVKGKMVVIPA